MTFRQEDRNTIKNEHRSRNIKRRAASFGLVVLLAASLLLGACGTEPDTGSIGPVGPQGPVGPKGRIGPQPLKGTLPSNLMLIEDSGRLVTEEHETTSFQRVEIDDSFKVDIRQGEALRAVTHVEENAAPYIHVAVDGNTLKIGLDPDKTYHMINIDLQAEITVPELTGMVLDGGSDVMINGFTSTDDLSVVLDLGSTLRGDIKAGAINITASLGSRVTLSGSAEDATVAASLDSEVDLSELHLETANVTADTSSSVDVRPDK